MVTSGHRNVMLFWNVMFFWNAFQKNLSLLMYMHNWKSTNKHVQKHFSLNTEKPSDWF